MNRLLTLLAAFGLLTALGACTMNDVDPPSEEAGEAVAEESTGQIYQ